MILWHSAVILVLFISHLLVESTWDKKHLSERRKELCLHLEPIAPLQYLRSQHLPLLKDSSINLGVECITVSGGLQYLVLMFLLGNVLSCIQSKTNTWDSVKKILHVHVLALLM